MRIIGGKSLISHFATISLGTIVNIIVGILSVPIITRLVLPCDYGDYSMFMLYADIAVMVLCFGMDQSLVRFYYSKDTIEYKRDLLKKCLRLPILLFCAFTLLYLLLSITTSVSFGFSRVVTITLFAYIFTQIINRFSFLLVRLQYNSKLFATLNVVNKSLFAVLAIILLLLFDNNDLFILCITTLIAVLIVTLWGVISEKNIWQFSTDHIELNNYRTIVKYGAPFIFSLGIITLFNGIDKIALKYYCGSTELGVYSGALNLIKVFTIIQTTFNSLWAPLAMESYEKDPENKQIFVKACSYVTILMFLLGLSLIVGKDLFALFLGPKYREASYIFPCLIFSPIMYTISETTCVGIDFSKKSYLHIWVALGACLTNIIGNILLVPAIGGKGAAISTGVSYIVFFALRTVLSRKQYPVNYAIYKVCIMTVLVLVYGLYNTFFKFSLFSVLGFVLCVSVLIMLYRTDILQMYYDIRAFVAKKKPNHN